MYCNPFVASFQTDIELCDQKYLGFSCTHIFVLSTIVLINDVGSKKMLFPSFFSSLNFLKKKWTGSTAAVSLFGFYLFFPFIQPLFRHRKKEVSLILQKQRMYTNGKSSTLSLKIFIIEGEKKSKLSQYFIGQHLLCNVSKYKKNQNELILKLFVILWNNTDLESTYTTFNFQKEYVKIGSVLNITIHIWNSSTV